MELFARCRLAAVAVPLGLGALACHHPSSASKDEAGSSVLPSSAPVDVVVLRDGDDYSVQVPRAATPCILYPERMFDTTLCPVEARPMSTPPPGSSRSRLVAMGLVRFADQDEVRMGQLTVSYNRVDHAQQPTQAVASSFAAGMVDSLVRSVPGAAVASGGPSVRLMTTDSGLPVTRVSFDVSRISGDTPRLEHSVSFTVWSVEGAYTFSLSARRQYADLMDGLAQQMASSLRVAHPAPPAM